MARGDSLSRLEALGRLLNSQAEFDVEELARRLGCTRRTLYRDLNVLERGGWPLVRVTEGNRVRWRVLDNYKRTLSVRLSVQEVVALVAAEQLLSSAAGTLFARAAHSAVGKLKDQLEAPLRQRVERLAPLLNATVGATRNLSRHAEHLDAFFIAAETREVVELHYKKLGARAPSRYTVEPHELHMQGSSVYIVGWARERAAARIFLLDRVTQVHRTGEHFERRPELPQGVFEQGAFGLWEGEAKLVRLKFNGTAAQIVSEQRLHPSQRILDHSASSLTMELLVPLSPALVSWVTGFGKRVEVLEPESLRAQL